ncbi:MAG: DNA-3-methyladenine glycosylase I [gamma proteobacterium symbiont of Lucinoma myriamae]|nr:DNA-3-methyladenine glycosylase I [gamma proteobacterium symbiont of Lucinoma myriamae]
MKHRCKWCGEDELYQHYHDTEWGVPSFNDQHLFEMLILEGAQAGLSWITVLKKRAHYQQVFDHFDAGKIAQYDEHKIALLLQDAGIIRNRLKVNSAVSNARLFLEIQSEYGSFADYIWQFVDGEPIVNHRKTLADIPVTTKESDRMSKELKKKGFKFVGSTICYAYMQAVGMVNDHTTDCFRYSARFTY